MKIYLLIILYSFLYSLSAQTFSIPFKFSSGAIAEGNYIWFTSVIRLWNVDNYPVTVNFSNQSIYSSAFSLFPPDASITLDASGTAVVNYANGRLETVTPLAETVQHFVAGLIYQMPAGGIPSALDPVTWTATISSSEPLRIKWKWTAAVFSDLSNDYNLLGIDPLENIDEAGTPNNYVASLIAGACDWGYSTTATIDITTPLPVQYSNLFAEIFLNHVKLRWSTATELNNDYFTLERSEDCRRFTEIAQIDGAGNSSVLLNYHFEDKGILQQKSSGTIYYRIKQSDFDGRYSFSDTVSVRIKSAAYFNVFPNPSPELDFSIQGKFDCVGSLTISIKDISGKENFSKIYSCGQEFSEDIKLDNPLCRGVYVISANTENDSYVQKLVVE